jgi:ribulose-phosphate 3-epimerase
MEFKIAPSLLSADFARLGEDLARAEAAGADWHHVDVMDGHFVHNITIGVPVVKSLKATAKIPLDVHLMITDPWRHADAFLEAGADVLTFHAETLYMGEASPLIDRIHAAGAKAALSINPETSEEILVPYLDSLDMILVMSVRPGFGGQSFREDVLDKVKRLREVHGFTGDIEMDGGISRHTIAACAEAGCNVFVAGSALYGAEDMQSEIEVFRDAIGVV